MSKKTSSPVVPKTPTQFLLELRGQSRDAQTARLTSYVADTVIELLRPTGEVSREALLRGFIAVGLDSLLAIELLVRFERDFGAHLSPDVLEEDTVEDVVDYLIDNVVHAAAA